jgi:hypothetical protein
MIKIWRIDPAIISGVISVFGDPAISSGAISVFGFGLGQAKNQTTEIWSVSYSYLVVHMHKVSGQ